ncbi:hypothetical protein JCM1840_000916 [Sporobolomyces johnsonii]
MLFDTPLLNLAASTPVASSSTGPHPTSGSAKKRKRSNSTGGGADSKDAATKGAEVNLDKLMKKMKSMEGSATGGNRTPVGIKEGGKSQGKGKGKGKKGDAGGDAGFRQEQQQQHQQHVQGESKGNKKAKKQKPAAAAAARPSPSPSTRTAPLPSSPAPPSAPFRHSAPNIAASTAPAAPPQTAMQAQLRAKLAGGKFRMLNETLYTTTGADAWRLMKEDGAFDDYHTGFRSQATNWPVHPLSLIANSLLSSLAPNSLIADFGCGDAALARTLCPSASPSPSGASLKLKLTAPKTVAQKSLKVLSFDLVSQNPFVIEAECSSVPLPGSPVGTGNEGQVVDAVVCCLSLMGTDWVMMVREARRVLKDGGKLLVAEVTSRFDKVDEFVKLVEAVGFECTAKDESNTHFILFDFTKTSTSAESNEAKKAEQTRKAATLLKPCIYKKR